MSSLTFSRDSKILITGGQTSDPAGVVGAWMAWDISTGRLLSETKAHGKSYVRVAVSPDGNHLATIGNNGDVRFWPMPKAN